MLLSEFYYFSISELELKQCENPKIMAKIQL